MVTGIESMVACLNVPYGNPSWETSSEVILRTRRRAEGPHTPMVDREEVMSVNTTDPSSGSHLRNQ